MARVRIPQPSEHAVSRADHLPSERGQAHQLLPELRERAAVARHLGPVVRRAHGLGGRAGVENDHFHRRGDSTDGAENHRIGGVGAVRIHAVELVTRATIPEVAEVERGVDVRRGVAARHSTHVVAADTETVGVDRSSVAHIGRR